MVENCVMHNFSKRSMYQQTFITIVAKCRSSCLPDTKLQEHVFCTQTITSMVMDTVAQGYNDRQTLFCKVIIKLVHFLKTPFELKLYLLFQNTFWFNFWSKAPQSMLKAGDQLYDIIFSPDTLVSQKQLSRRSKGKYNPRTVNDTPRAAGP